MKILYISIIAVTVLLLVPIMMNNSVMAGCLIDNDWPNAPCHDTPGAMPSKETLREQWAPYYQYKGSAWMEMMKTQMIGAMKNGTLEDWVTGNQSNYDAWNYYYLNDQAPFFRSSVSGLNDEPHYIPPPLQQLKTGIEPKDVACKKSLQLVIKTNDGSSACVKPDTATKLVERGWACNTLSHSAYTIISVQTMNVTNSNLSVNYTITNAKILDIKADTRSASIIISMKTSGDGNLDIAIPRTLVEYPHGKMDPHLFVLGNGQEIDSREINTTSNERTLSIPFKADTNQIEIIGVTCCT